MKMRSHLASILFTSLSFFFSFVAYAESGPITQIKIQERGDQLSISWIALGQDWEVSATRISYLAPSTPVLEVDTDTGDESLLKYLPNCYFTGSLVGSTEQFATAYVNLCPGNYREFIGFVSSGGSLYGMDGTNMSLLETGSTGGAGEDSGTDNNGKRTQGPSSADPVLYEARRGDASLFPSIEIAVDPSFVSVVGAENYIDRIMENLALANMIFERSLIKPINLIAILVLTKDITTSDSQGNILGEVEKLRKQNIQANSGDITMFITGKEFSMPSLWGWAEGGYACALQQAVAEGDKLNTHTIGKSAGVVKDLPTLMQRGWVLGHEVGHLLGAGHWANDPLMDGGFQPELTLQDYNTRCEVLRSMLETCAYDLKNKKFTDFYECP